MAAVARVFLLLITMSAAVRPVAAQTAGDAAVAPEGRFLVVPLRPPGTDSLDEEALSELVTRDSMIGVAHALQPQPV